jgi:nitroimidazol reductase NimA-like FMN-containing flavoprotein (pyridoxamine 5'-phosphate oxidase superfamily)
LSTLDADGRPHMTAVGAFWVDGRYYFSGGPRSRKIRNIEHGSRCAFGVAIHGYNVALEGRAAR